jgi:arylsulfatase A
MKLLPSLLVGLLFGSAVWAQARLPNVVLINADDLGYTDLGCYGAKGWTTPNLDALAKSGLRFTDFHVSQAVCSASRTSLLTGCYANRLGIHGALSPKATHGIAKSETTLAEMFQAKKYATGMVGKWHLGHHEQFLPTNHGFDSYLGLPYSNDMWPHRPDRSTYHKLVMYENTKIIDDDVTAEDQPHLTTKYTERAVEFITANKAKPFFLYVAHSMPHVPLFVSEKFRGKSKQGLYGDVIQEIDWSVGEILAALKKHQLEKDTIVIFTSDNGPWLGYGNHSGTCTGLREGKGTVFEGGHRVPMIARWPGKIPADAVQNEMMMTIDLFPTLAKLIGAELPKHTIDGLDCWPILAGEKNAKNPHDAHWHYYAQNELRAVRSGPWKLILPHKSQQMLEDRKAGADGLNSGYKVVSIDKPLLYNLSDDVAESKNVIDQNPDVVEQLMKHVGKAREELGDSLTKAVGKGTRKPDEVK